ncbi:unnamed protein product [Polarella glacialis]|uniref:Uncharacterized protein n=1 Tax=Polarella glacialis TaxID=89957 RepID=A0A813FK51_POLGL|nr:unnamed protein product [Polarella glacialis]|mmetsp:Transcript_8717/g.13853  ORF Transcript_8717/g.13853 Transcript_8717/m.13853 type:complete len:208 (-) Transcript_8717:47-670(-)
MMYPQGAEASWPGQAPYMVQMVPVPMMGASQQGYGPAQLDPRLGFTNPALYAANMQASECAIDMGLGSMGGLMPPGGSSSLFKYPSDNIVMAAGQYREVRPAVAQIVLVGGGNRFHCEPAELPPGLQLDPATGTIWGTPVSPPSHCDPAGPYHNYTVVCSGAGGVCTCKVGLKVVQFSPQSFNISHISQLEKNKYMVLVDTNGAKHR